MLRRPKRPDAAVIVGAYNDAYVSQKSVRELAQHWPGSQVRTSPVSPPLTSDMLAPNKDLIAQGIEDTQSSNPLLPTSQEVSAC